MKASTMFMKTLPFCWAKLILGLANVLDSVSIMSKGGDERRGERHKTIILLTGAGEARTALEGWRHSCRPYFAEVANATK